MYDCMYDQNNEISLNYLFSYTYIRKLKLFITVFDSVLVKYNK